MGCPAKRSAYRSRIRSSARFSRSRSLGQTTRTLGTVPGVGPSTGRIVTEPSGNRHPALRRRGSPPSALGGARERLELRPLVVLRERVAQDGRRKAALGADGEALEIDVPGSLADAPLELVHGLVPRRLR